jgi:hypothetical protein
MVAVLSYPHHIAIIHDQYDLPAKDHPMGFLRFFSCLIFLARLVIRKFASLLLLAVSSFLA